MKDYFNSKDSKRPFKASFFIHTRKTIYIRTFSMAMKVPYTVMVRMVVVHLVVVGGGGCCGRRDSCGGIWIKKKRKIKPTML